MGNVTGADADTTRALYEELRAANPHLPPWDTVIQDGLQVVEDIDGAKLILATHIVLPAGWWG